MSVPVEPEELAAAAAEYGRSAYVLTADDDGRPRVTHVVVSVDGDRVTAEVGRSAARNVRARPAVTLLWPARREGDYSLIADGRGAVDSAPGDVPSVSVKVTSAVLHRPAQHPERTDV